MEASMGLVVPLNVFAAALCFGFIAAIVLGFV